MHKPAHIGGPVEEKYKANCAHGRSALGNQDDGKNREKLSCIVHAQVVPAPAAVMCNELGCCLVEQHVLLVHDVFFLAEGSDYGCASHAFIEVGVDWDPERAMNAPKIVISLKEGRNNFAHHKGNN